jgi:RNA 2',3'-cyclic 3'-phosphodiesterase
MRRIFIAVPASEQMQRQVRKFSHTYAAFPVRWLHPPNLHITLIPPSEYTEESLQELIAKLETVTTPAPFEAHFTQADFGPEPDKPRLIWTTGDAPAELVQLKEGISAAVNYTSDRFLMHMTLARFPTAQFRPEWQEVFPQKTHMNMLIDRFAIMESIKIDGVTEYPILKEFMFT